eukprot:TRINITY_DN33939_c0_g1_i1.p1 TRINITY_DN33939_c0_g1~~TRINITY_DN33939_c0_g1_i1.p1  ORF type:complete len:652 (+),score=73.54 TRINITY_DN33939_c0_g1_i1:135-2090(+)
MLRTSIATAHALGKGCWLPLTASRCRLAFTHDQRRGEGDLSKRRAASDQDSWRHLAEDMKIAWFRQKDGGEAAATWRTRPDVEKFIVRAREALKVADVLSNVDIFYWLCKHAKTVGIELDDSLLLDYLTRVRQQAMSGSEGTLVRVMVTLSSVLNKNRIAHAIDTDALELMEACVHGLLSAALPRLCARHSHLPMKDISIALSIYAKVYREEYGAIFSALAGDGVARATDPRLQFSDEYRFDFFRFAPHVLMSYARVSCAHEDLFTAYINVLEDNMEEHTYDTIGIVAYAISEAGIKSPVFWSILKRELLATGDGWSPRALASVLGACRRLISRGDIELIGGSSSDVDSELPLLFLAAKCMVTHFRFSQSTRFHSDEWSIVEATEMVMACSLLPLSELSRGDTKNLSANMIRCACEMVHHTVGDSAPDYLASMFHALVGIYSNALTLSTSMEPGTDAHDPITEIQLVLPLVRSALIQVGAKLQRRLFMCDKESMETVSQALLTISRHDYHDSSLIDDMRAADFLRVQQRELVRRANDYDLPAFINLACAVVAAARSVDQARATKIHVAPFARAGHPPSSGTSGYCDDVLRPWFLSSIMACASTSSVDGGPSVPDRRQMDWIMSVASSNVATSIPSPPFRWKASSPSVSAYL